MSTQTMQAGTQATAFRFKAFVAPMTLEGRSISPHIANLATRCVLEAVSKKTARGNPHGALTEGIWRAVVEEKTPVCKTREEVHDVRYRLLDRL